MSLGPPTRPRRGIRRGGVQALAEIHGLTAQLSLILVVVVTGFATVLVVQRRSAPTFYLGGVLWAGLVVTLAALTGIGAALANGPPADPLHIVYGVLAVAALPGAAVIARGRTEGAETVIWAIAGVVLVILVLRLFQTSA